MLQFFPLLYEQFLASWIYELDMFSWVY